MKDLCLWSYVLDVIHQVFNIFFAQFDVMFFAEVIYCTCYLAASILTLLWCEDETEGCSSDSTAEECANVT